MTDFPTFSYASTSEIPTLFVWKSAPFGRSLPMQDIMGSNPKNTVEKFTNFGMKEGFQGACSLILREDLTDLVETYKVDIIFFHSRRLANWNKLENRYSTTTNKYSHGKKRVRNVGILYKWLISISLWADSIKTIGVIWLFH